MPNSLLLIAIATLYLAGLQAGFPDRSLHSTGRSGQLELSLSAPKAEYAVGEMVPVTMTLGNIGPGPAALRPSTIWLFDFAVYDDSGRQIDTWAGGRPFPMAPPTPITIRPGEVITRTLVWDLALPGPDGRKSLRPGRYALEGFLSGSRDFRGGLGRPGAYPLPLRTPRLVVNVH